MDNVFAAVSQLQGFAGVYRAPDRIAISQIRSGDVTAPTVLPAVQNARTAARRTQCTNNMRNVGLAVLANATKRNDQIPPYGRFTPVLPSGVLDPTPHQIECAALGGVNWVVDCLGELDRQDIYEFR